MKMRTKIKELWEKLDKAILLIPITIVILLTIVFSVFPSGSSNVIDAVYGFLTQKLDWWYLIFGVAILILLIYMAASKKIGTTKLGKPEDKPMKRFTYGALVFTSTMAADIMFYAFHEWTYYWDYNVSDLADTSTTSAKVLWSSTFSYVNWGFIPWAIYIVLAVIYGYMFYKSGRRDKQRISEACRSLIGRHADGPLGKSLDIVAITCLFFGTSTTFSIATPFMTAIICKLFNVAMTPVITIVTLLVIAAIYTAAVLIGNKGISVVAKIATILVSIVLALFFVLGGPQFILETGFQGIGNMFAHYAQIVTWTDPVRASSFPQAWSLYFICYWCAWAVGTPFFIAKISKGRTIRQTIIESMTYGLLGTFMSFMVLGGFGMNIQASGALDVVGMINNGITPAQAVVEMITTIQIWPVLVVLIFIAMAGLYASTFDALTSVVASMSYKSLDIDEEPHKAIKIFYAFIFIALPIALTFMESTTNMIMCMSIIAALPYSLIIVLAIISFFKDIKSYTSSINISHNDSDELESTN